ncbi:MAG: hypothetical protein ACLFUS_14010 [Candidatus Sumerlaeia bacterium]
MSEEKKKGGGCWKWGGLGCLVLLVVIIVGGYFVAMKARDFAIEGLGNALITEIKTGLQEINYPGEEAQEVIAVLEKFQADLKAGKIKIRQLDNIIQSIAESGVIAGFAARLFSLNYLNQVEMSPAEMQQAQGAISRFMKAVSESNQAFMESEEFRDMMALMVNNPEEVRQALKEGLDSQNAQNFEPQFKEKLSKEEINQVLGIMNQVADDAGVTDKDFEMNLADQLQQAIDEGVSK